MSDRRINTPAPILTLEGLAFHVDEIGRDLGDLRATMETVKTIELMLIEAIGRSGKNGRLGHIEQRLADSATSQGIRIGALEVEVGKLKQTKAQLFVLGALGLALLAALAKVVFAR